MPWAPANRQARAARTTSGSLPPRELRITAILLTLTLSVVIARDPSHGRAGSLSRRLGGRLRACFARFGDLAQAAQFHRVDHMALVAAATAYAGGIPAHDPGDEQ